MATKKTAPKKEKKPYKILKKKSGRYSVKGDNGKFVNGADKVAILAKEGLIKTMKAKKPVEAVPAEAPAE